jgi:tetratricopeptide (TPR) repeat protein
MSTTLTKKQRRKRKIQNLSSPKRKSSHINFWKDKTVLFGLCLVLALTFIAFGSSLQNGFVNWDDGDFIYDNLSIRSLSWENIQTFFTSNVLGAYAPLVFLSYAIEYALFELDPFYYHLDNLILHLACVFLVYKIAISLNMGVTGAIITALLFGIHPMRVESVAWITERKDVLFGVFFLAAMLNYIFYVRRKSRKSLYFLLCLFFFSLSLLSKIQAVAFPLVLLTLDYFLKRKLNKKLVFEKIPFFTFSLIMGVIGIFILENENVVGASEYGIIERLYLGGFAYLVYIFKAVIPYELSAIYPDPTHLTWYHYLSPFIVGLLGYFTWKAYRLKMHHLVFGVLFFTVNIMFMLQILSAGQGFLADRYTYIAYLGIFLTIGFVVSKLFEQTKWKSQIKVGLVIYFLILMATTWKQNETWKNGETLWTNVIEHYDDIVSPWSNRANYYRDNKQFEKAQSDYAKALSLDPSDHEVYNSRGKMYFDMGNALGSISDFNKAIELDANKGAYYINRGISQGQLASYEKSLLDLNKGLQLEPDHVNGYRNRCNVYFLKGDFENALKDTQLFLKYNPYISQVWSIQSVCYERTGNFYQALRSINMALQIDPGIKLYYKNRARYQRGLGNVEAAKLDEQRAGS